MICPLTLLTDPRTFDELATDASPQADVCEARTTPKAGARPASFISRGRYAQEPRTPFDTEPRDCCVRRSRAFVQFGEGRDAGGAFGSPCRSRSTAQRMPGRHHCQIRLFLAQSRLI